MGSGMGGEIDTLIKEDLMISSSWSLRCFQNFNIKVNELDELPTQELRLPMEAVRAAIAAAEAGRWRRAFLRGYAGTTVLLPAYPKNADSMPGSGKMSRAAVHGRQPVSGQDKGRLGIDGMGDAH
jgi:hypothetical protein